MKIIRVAVRLDPPPERERGADSYIESVTADFEPPAEGATLKFVQWSLGCAYVTWVIP